MLFHNRVMKTMLPSFALVILATGLLAGCSSNDPTSSGQPVAAQREDAKKYGTPARLSSDPSSPLHGLEASKGQVSTKIAEF